MVDFEDQGKRAVWIASSGKMSHEICHVVDGSTDTFWQSDGALPHLITILFPELTLLKDIELYVDYSMDESYTPLELVIRIGLQRNELFDVHHLELDEPKGWIGIPLLDSDGSLLVAHVLQICLLSNYQDGRDSRIRNIRIMGGPVG